MKNTNAKKYIFGLIQMIFALIVFGGAANAATYLVTNTSDAGAGSLRQAILNANANAGADTINFNISGNGVQIIAPQTELPKITEAVTINGTTQPGYTNNPLISIAGGNQNYDYGLSVEFGTATIKALNIYGFKLGIEVNCSPASCANNRPGLILTGSRIGTNYNGTSIIEGNRVGIYINGAYSASTQIGGTGANEGNVISGNWDTGIELAHDYCNGCSVNNDPTRSHKIIGNKIGTNWTGTAALPNDEEGIYVRTQKVTVGGDTAAERNVISGNDETGIYVLFASDTVIEGNYIGTNAAGDAAVPNGFNGVFLTATESVRIGGTAPGTGNTISGNGSNGIQIGAYVWQSCGALGCSAPTVYKATDNLIYGNRIGTNAAGTAAVPNALHGVEINADGTIIGQSETGGASNTISGNGGSGVFIFENSYQILSGSDVLVGSMNNRVQRNYIGTNAAGAILGNGGAGVEIFNNASYTMVGGNDAAQKNQISNNNGPGVLIHKFAVSEIAPADNQITVNDISANGGKGIAIYAADGDGTDALDADAGANDLMNRPVLTGAFPAFIAGTYHGLASKTFILHFYSSPTCDASGRGEGKIYLGSHLATTDANGNANFTTNFGAATGAIITVTATSSPRGGEPTGTTSEFSNCVTAQAANPGNFSLNSATYTATEATNAVVVTVNRTGGTLGGVSVNYATTDGMATAGQDYTNTHGTLTFAAGETSKQFSIPILEDNLDEPNETLGITLSNPSVGAGLISPSSATLTIGDNDATPTLSISDVSQAEGNENITDFNFVVTMNGASSQTVTINYQTAGGTATGGIDYTTTSGTLSFASGETTKTITVPVFGELTVEINEIFNINLSAPSNATISDSQGVGTIQDDDNPGKFSFALAPYNTGEGSGFATVTVTRTNGDAGTTTVDYATTTGGTAMSASDFTPVSDTLVFLDGELQKSFTVAILEDQITEQTETVNLVLSNPTGGATLGLAAAVVNIIDNDSGTPLTISGAVRKPDNSPLANAQVSLQGSQNLTTQTDANGDFTFAGLNPNGNYTVTPSAIGYVFNPINREYLNLSASVTNANFTANSTPNRALRVVGKDTVAGQTAEATVELVAQGDENSVSFSLQFNQAILSNPNVALGADALSASLIVNDSQAAQGRIGIVLAMPAGQTFSAGTKSLVVLMFNSTQTNAFSTPLDFISQPVTREVASVNADPLTATWTNGAITFAQGIEGDVMARPTGNGSVTVSDFTQIGRFVAGLNNPDQLNEFQRADIAPRISKGNGALTVSDYTQAGRYAAGLDALQTAGGATSANFGFSSINEQSAIPNSQSQINASRTVRVKNITTQAGQQVFVQIEIDALGNENGFGFSLDYDAARLSNPSPALGADTQGATLITNTNTVGKVGVLFGLPAGTTLQAGTKHIITIRFNVAQNAGGQVPLTFADAPVFREVVDSDANPLAVDFANGFVNILSPSSATVTVGGRITNGTGGVSKVTVVMTKPDGSTQTALTNSFGYYQFKEVEIGETYIFSAVSKRYQFTPASQVLTIDDEIANLNFTAIEQQLIE